MLLAGGQTAFETFHRVSGGCWLDGAPEYYLTSHIASAVDASFDGRVWLEASVKETRQLAGERRGCPSDKERRNGRFDIVCYWPGEEWQPRALIEVKSPLHAADSLKVVPDIERLCRTLTAKPDSPIEFGAFIYYASVNEPKRKHADAAKKIADLNLSIYERAKSLEISLPVLCRCFPEKITPSTVGTDQGAWSISAIVVRRT
jgi:hypothetical protein